MLALIEIETWTPIDRAPTHVHDRGRALGRHGVAALDLIHHDLLRGHHHQDVEDEEVEVVEGETTEGATALHIEEAEAAAEVAAAEEEGLQAMIATVEASEVAVVAVAGVGTETEGAGDDLDTHQQDSSQKSDYWHGVRSSFVVVLLSKIPSFLTKLLNYAARLNDAARLKAHIGGLFHRVSMWRQKVLNHAAWLKDHGGGLRQKNCYAARQRLP